MTKNQKTVQVTKKWIETFVLNLNLCPFARHPYRNDKIRYVVFEGNDLKELGNFVVKEFDLMTETAPSVLETSIIILQDALPDFREYLDIFYAMEDLLADMDLEGVLQLASFHPDYMFEETEPTDAENYTNRSPYPLIHILREDSITRSIEAFPEVGDIIEQNQDTMNKIGLTKLKQMFDELHKTP
jgi:uncharacterized protein